MDCSSVLNVRRALLRRILSVSLSCELLRNRGWVSSTPFDITPHCPAPLHPHIPDPIDVDPILLQNFNIPETR